MKIGPAHARVTANTDAGPGEHFIFTQAASPRPPPAVGHLKQGYSTQLFHLKDQLIPVKIKLITNYFRGRGGLTAWRWLLRQCIGSEGK